MVDPYLFAEVLGRYVQRSAYSTGQLASLTSLPKTTIGNWLEGRVKRPRHWQGVVELALAMRLTEEEANELLAAARHPSIQELKTVANVQEKEWFVFWQTAVSTPQPIPFQAIPLPPYFVGREDELNQLEALLSAKQHTAVICLHGMAGVGKTSLAAQLAYQLRDHFADGVLWARLDSSDSMSILATFADAYQRDMTHYHDVASRSRVVRDLLTDKQTLLVLDNAQTSAQIEPLLPPTGRCAVLVTTRHQNLAILAGAKWVQIRPFSNTTATSLILFSKILGEQRAEVEQELIEQIANELGHLPLALVIAACRLAYEPGWQTDTLHMRLQQVQKRLKTLRFEAQDVQLSFQLSYQWLDAPSQQIFMATGVLGRQDFAAEPIAALVAMPIDDTADHLRLLAALSLLQSQQNGRFQLHPLLHDFAQNLQSTNELSSKMIDYWSHFIKENKHSYPRLKQEFGHIAAALNLAEESGEANRLLFMLEDLNFFFIAQGSYEQASQYLARAETAVANTNNNIALANIHLLITQLERHRHRLDQAEKHAQLGFELIEKDRDAQLFAYFLAEIGILHNCRGYITKGKSYLIEARSLAQKNTPDPDLMLNILSELGVVSSMKDEDAQAQEFYNEALPIALAHPNKTHAVMLLKSLGAIQHLQQNYGAAHDFFREAYTLANDIDYRKGLMIVENNLGVAAFIKGDANRAENYFQNGLEKAEQLQDPQGLLMLLHNLGRLLRHNGRFSAAQSYLARALALAQADAAQQRQVEMHNDLGILAAMQDDLETAVFHFEKAYDLAEGLSARWQAEVLFAWGIARLHQGDVTTARSHFAQLQKLIAENKATPAFKDKVKRRVLQLEEVENGRNPSIAFPPEHLKIFI